MEGIAQGSSPLRNSYLITQLFELKSTLFFLFLLGSFLHISFALLTAARWISDRIFGIDRPLRVNEGRLRRVICQNWRMAYSILYGLLAIMAVVIPPIILLLLADLFVLFAYVRHSFHALRSSLFCRALLVYASIILLGTGVLHFFVSDAACESLSGCLRMNIALSMGTLGVWPSTGVELGGSVPGLLVLILLQLLMLVYFTSFVVAFVAQQVKASRSAHPSGGTDLLYLERRQSEHSHLEPFAWVRLIAYLHGKAKKDCTAYELHVKTCVENKKFHFLI